jgi:fatty acid desaturase
MRRPCRNSPTSAWICCGSVGLEHLYHLEHHLYPKVPHHNWPALGRRLDPYFQAAGVEPIVLGF